MNSNKILLISYMLYNWKLLYNIYYIQQMTQLFEIKVKLSENQKKNLPARKL